MATGIRTVAMTSAIMTADAEPLTLDRLQRDILVPQLEGFIAALPDADARAPYLALRQAIETLEVPPALITRLGTVAEVLLSSGRVRHLYGPGAELSLWSLFQKTPRGREAAASIEAANAALRQLVGQPIERISVSARGPATYALTIKTAELQMVVGFDSAGVRLENVEVGT
jgi:hypothetical protein